MLSCFNLFILEECEDVTIYSVSRAGGDSNVFKVFMFLSPESEECPPVSYPPRLNSMLDIVTWYVSDGGGGGCSGHSIAGAVRIQTTGVVTGINHFLRHRSRSCFAADCGVCLLRLHLRVLGEGAELGGDGGGGEVVEGGEGRELLELLRLLDRGPGLQHHLGLEPVAGVEVD